MKKILIMYFVLLTGCSINSSSNISSSETSLSNNILNTSSNNTSETIANFAYITGIKLEDVKYVGYCLSGQSYNNVTDNQEIINKIYNSVNKEYFLSNYIWEDIRDSNLMSYTIFIYYSRMDYYQLNIYDNHLYFKSSLEDTYYYKSTTEWVYPL